VQMAKLPAAITREIQQGNVSILTLSFSLGDLLAVGDKREKSSDPYLANLNFDRVKIHCMQAMLNSKN